MITGLFENKHVALTALREMEARGIPGDAISVVATGDPTSGGLGVETKSKLPEGTAIGATAGGAIAALAGGLSAIGVLASSGALLAAGPVVAALAAAGAGATGGAVVGAFIGATVPEHEMKLYESALEAGSVLVGIECGDRDRWDAARAVLREYGATRVSSA